MKYTKPKKKNAKNRKKSACVNFRVTPEEKEIIFNRIRLSGLKIQDYVAQSCMYNQISVVGNVKTFNAIRNEMRAIDEHLMLLKSVDELDLKNLFNGDWGNFPQRAKLYKSILLADLDKVEKVVLASGILVMPEASFLLCHFLRQNN